MLYTVYGLHEAGKPDEIEYVGCTRQSPKDRLAGHLSDARHRRRPVNKWVAKLVSEGKRVLCRSLLQTEDIVFAYQMEEEMIVYFAERGPSHNVEGNPIPLRKALAGAEEALRIVRAKIADGSLDIQSFLSEQN